MTETEVLHVADGLLVLGDEDEKQYGRQNFLSLYSVFRTPEEVKVLTTDYGVIGTLQTWFVQQVGQGGRFVFVLAGQLVHQGIEELLRSLGRDRSLTLETLQGTAIKRLELARLQPRRGRWRRDPKRHCNLFEDYNGSGVSDQDLEQARDRISAALASFCRSDTLATIRGIDPVQWRSVEELRGFEVQGFPVLVVMDLAVDLDGELAIYDWKTGGAYEGHLEQLACYALYPETEWGYAPEDVVLRVFYLNQDHLHEERASAAYRQATIDRIVNGCVSMQRCLADPERNTARKEDSSMADDPGPCSWCFYQELCPERPGA